MVEIRCQSITCSVKNVNLEIKPYTDRINRDAKLLKSHRRNNILTISETDIVEDLFFYTNTPGGFRKLAHYIDKVGNITKLYSYTVYKNDIKRICKILLKTSISCNNSESISEASGNSIRKDLENRSIAKILEPVSYYR